MKKTLLTFVFGCLFAGSSLAVDFSYGGINYTVLSETDKTCMTKIGGYSNGSSKYAPGTEASGDIVIPAKVTFENVDYTVTEIGSYSFAGNSNLKSIVLPSTITNLNVLAFGQCTSLTNVSLPDDLTEIGMECFSECTALESIVLPSKLERIYSGAFYKCTSLKSIDIPYGCKDIYVNAFIACYALENISIGKDTNVDDNAWGNFDAFFDIDCTATNTTMTFKVNKLNVTVYDANGKTETPELNLAGRDLGKVQIGKTYVVKDLMCGFGYHLYVTPGIKLADAWWPRQITVDVNGDDSYADALVLEADVMGYDDNPYAPEITATFTGAYAGTVTFSSDQTLVLPVDMTSTKKDISCEVEVRVEHQDHSASISRKTYKFTLPSLKWGKISALATSLTSARLTAEVNLSNYCTTAGIEWRRNDAPDNVPSTKVACPVAEGMLIGTLRNLSSDVYYQYRPYVQDEAGNYNYGEWVGFYTGDANVFFEPETRTYSPKVVDNGVQFYGYALEGSDNITEQGFEYTPRSGSRADDSQWIRVPATGILMSATVEGLNGEYVVRTYVDTPSKTYHGDEVGFAVGEVNGIQDVDFAAAELEQPNHIYNLQGVCLKRNATPEDVEALSPGLYVVGGKKVLKK